MRERERKEEKEEMKRDEESNTDWIGKPLHGRLMDVLFSGSEGVIFPFHFILVSRLLVG